MKLWLILKENYKKYDCPCQGNEVDYGVFNPTPWRKKRKKYKEMYIKIDEQVTKFDKSTNIIDMHGFFSRFTIFY